MEKRTDIKAFFTRLLLLLPFIYIGCGWYVGLNYGRKPLIFGPYPDIPVSISTSILGSKISDICGTDVFVGVSGLNPPKQSRKSRSRDNRVYFNVNAYFELPGSWSFDFPPAGSKSKAYAWTKTFLLIGNYSYAICRELRNPKRVLGTIPLDDFYWFLKRRGRTEDIERLRPYLFLAGLKARYPWLYSETVLLSRTMGNVFSEQGIPYDILGLSGILVLFIVLNLHSFSLWGYYLLWVFSYWFGRVGFHDPVLAFSREGWQVILWSFWNGFVRQEGRIFLIIAVGVSGGIFVIWVIVYLLKHVLPRKVREMEDFLKIDRDTGKRKELSIENVKFKSVEFNINRKLLRYAPTDKYFLGVDDHKKDILVAENMLNHHLHILGPTGSGKTSLIILPLSRQAIEKGRGCCFIDFKGDDVFKKYVMQKAAEQGKRFYYFSIDPAEPSVGYNPLFSGDVHSKVDRIMTALELIYQGPAGFYSNVQAMAFTHLLKKLSSDNREINFNSVKRGLVNPQVLEVMGASSQEVKGLVAAISWIAEADVINRNELDLARVIQHGDIVFFALKSQVNTSLAEAIGRMLIIDLKSQAVSRKETDPPYFIFIDEFQNLACSHFVDVISKVRSANFCLVLSNQSRGNLSSVSAAFENAIFTNTATKVIFMQEDPQDARFWSEKTGKTIYQDKNILQFDTMDNEGLSVRLDGLRSAQGSLHPTAKNYISENIFLRLPFSKSVIFSRGNLTCIANHEFLFNKTEKDKFVSAPFEWSMAGAVQQP